jgi:hypothetical protein
MIAHRKSVVVPMFCEAVSLSGQKISPLYLYIFFTFFNFCTGRGQVRANRYKPWQPRTVTVSEYRFDLKNDNNCL